MMKYRIVKTCPSVPNFREEFPVSFSIIKVISDMTRRSTEQDLNYLTYSVDSVLEMLLDRKTIRVLNLFGTVVEWNLERAK